MTPDEMRFEARMDTRGARIWDTRHGCWMSAAHPNHRWMEDLAVMLSIQSNVRDEMRTDRQARPQQGAA
jgi:hypothetical protein